MQIGYARVSTQDQDLRLQCEALRQTNCDKIYKDKASGASASREGMQDGISPREVAQNLGVSIPMLYRWLPASHMAMTKDTEIDVSK